MSRPPRTAVRSAPLVALVVVVLTALAVLALPGTAFAVDVIVDADGVDPDPVIAEVGEQVVFVNEGTQDVRLVDDEGRWDSGDLAPGESFAISFDAAGIISFTSEDGAVTGTIQVGGATPPPTAEPIPSAEPTEEPTAEPTAEATAQATAEPTDEPTADPTSAPTDEPVDALADTGLPSGALLAVALLGLLAGVVALRRTAR